MGGGERAKVRDKEWVGERGLRSGVQGGLGTGLRSVVQSGWGRERAEFRGTEWVGERGLRSGVHSGWGREG